MGFVKGFLCFFTGNIFLCLVKSPHPRGKSLRMEHNFDLAAANLQIIIELRKEMLRIIYFFISFLKEMENRTFLSIILLRLQLLK